MEKNSPKNKIIVKAGELFCPTCFTEYVEVEFDLEVDGAIIPKVKALKCPKCEEEIFTPQQVEEIKKKINKCSS